MTRRKNQMEMPGTDSFLDVIANLVGILIILVVVVGASAATAWTTQKSGSQDQAAKEKLLQLQQQSQLTAETALKYQQDNQMLEAKIATEESIVAAKKQIRHQMLTVIDALERKLDSKKFQLDQQSRERFEKKSEIFSLKSQLKQVSYEVEKLKSRKPRTEQIDHYPTPVAKTVFNREYHFRLKNGLLVEVPLEQLVRAVKAELRVKAEKLQREGASSTIETVGPIGNFRIQYLLSASNSNVATPAGYMKQRIVEFKQFVLLPINEQAGEKIEIALKQNSNFDRMIQKLKPGKTTISIWVYPNSYREFNQLKKWLYERGFQTAVWPLSTDAPISGGPNGFRSVSQ